MENTPQTNIPPTSTPTNSPQITQQPTTRQKSSLPLILGGLLLLIVGLASGYYVGSQQKTATPVPVATPDTKVTTNKPTPIASTLEGTFQEILTENCMKTPQGVGSYNYLIDSEKVPVVVDATSIDIVYPSPGKFLCDGTADETPGTGYFFVGVKDKAKVNIYDSNSKEFGHGGAPFLGPHGVLVKSDDEMKWSVYLNFGSGPAIVGETEVILRAEKTMTLSNGETIYANYYTTAMTAKDSRLVAYLNEHSKPLEGGAEGVREITYDSDVDIKAEFFSDLSNLQSTEKEAWSEIETVLSAVTPK